MKRIGCVVMASGDSQRYGANKLLEPLLGKPLLAHTLQKLTRLPLERVVIVTPYAPVQALAVSMGFSPAAPEGPHQNETVRAGVRAMAGLDGCMFCVGDQPLCTEQSLRRLLESFARMPDKIHRLYSGAVPGNPVLFPAALFAALAALPQDKGGSWLLREHPDDVVAVQVASPDELDDVDTPQKLAEVEAVLRKRMGGGEE